MRGWCQLSLALILLAGGALAEPPDTSPRPLPRPTSADLALGAPATDLAAQAAALGPDAQPEAAPQAEPAAEPQVVVSSGLRPRPRPAGLVTTAASTGVAADLPSGTEPGTNPTDAAEPPARRGLARLFGARAARTDPGRPLVESRKGSVCGVATIKGETLAPITSKTRGCGVADPVRVTSVDGVRLSQAITVDCPTAIALNTWVEQAVEPAFGRGEVVELTIAAHYICRPRNNVRGAKISEHGRGKAVDIAGFVLKNGRSVTVAGNYRGDIRKVHKAACGIFGTTLGPGSDGYHEDHLHFDTASQRNGPYCR